MVPRGNPWRQWNEKHPDERAIGEIETTGSDGGRAGGAERRRGEVGGGDDEGYTSISILRLNNRDANGVAYRKAINHAIEVIQVIDSAVNWDSRRA